MCKAEKCLEAINERVLVQKDFMAICGCIHYPHCSVKKARNILLWKQYPLAIILAMHPPNECIRMGCAQKSEVDAKKLCM
jgi:hypothetical protein